MPLYFVEVWSLLGVKHQTKPEPSSDWAALFPAVILALSLSYGGTHPQTAPPEEAKHCRRS